MKTLYFNEYNVQMGTFSYLPLVSGLLRTYAETFPEIKDNVKFMPFIYQMDEPEKILAQYTEPPDIAAFSSVMWNEQLNYHIAKIIKERYPNCLIVFGGPNVPMPPQHDVIKWMQQYPFIDIAVRAEGEEPFADILKMYLSGENKYDTIPSVAWNNNGNITFCNTPRPFKRDLSEYPSPYLEGVYDYLLEESKHGGKQFQAIIETNRGCPFPCTFCYWGRGGLSRKYKYHEMERVFAEIDWMGKNQIKYVFNADSNFGMNDRDYEIAEFIVKTKKKYGFPEKFRTCFGKNTDEKIFKIGSLLHSEQLEKGITLARQSNDETTLKNIRRQNIKMSTYVNLQKMYNDLDIPVYCELILGLPGETIETWKRGVDELLEAGTRNQLFVYLCQVLTNTEMAEDAYKEKFQIKTKRIPLAEIHGGIRPNGWVEEYEDIIISTSTMSVEDWKTAAKFSYTMMLFHSLKVMYYVMIYLLDKYNLKMSEFISYASTRQSDDSVFGSILKDFDTIIDGMLDGKHRGTILNQYGDLYWDVEEAAFLKLSSQPFKFYEEMYDLVVDFLKSRDIQLTDNNESHKQLLQVMSYQSNRIPNQYQVMVDSIEPIVVSYDWNMAEYFTKRFSKNEVQLVPCVETVTFHPLTYSDLPSFARQVILWGRKSGTMLIKHEYSKEEIACQK